METEAVGRVFASARKPGQPLYIGSVKTNIGHLEGGAGLAGLVKALFILERGQIPPNLWFETLNPRIDLKGWGLAVSLNVFVVSVRLTDRHDRSQLSLPTGRQKVCAE